MSLFLGLSLFSVVVWAFTHEKIPFLLSADEVYFLLYPRLSWTFFKGYCVVTALVGLWGIKRCVVDRLRQNKFIPWPQLGVTVMAWMTFVGPYFFVPIDALAVAVAIGTMFHNIQYFGFVWIFERGRASVLTGQSVDLSHTQELATNAHWKRYFAYALTYSLIIVLFYKLLPQKLGLVLVYFLAFAHYIIDGQIWKSSHNRLLGPTLARLASTEDSSCVPS